MIYATLESGNDLYGHVGDPSLETNLKTRHNSITEIQADGDELLRCCDILGRKVPPSRVYTFLGDNAKEIALNWYA